MSNDDSSIVIRIFSSNECSRCQMFKEECKKFGLPHLIVDANSIENQDICDQYEVNQLPHIQIIRESSGLVLLEYVGYIHPVSMLSTLRKKLKSRLNKKATAKVEGISEEEISKDANCKNCKKKNQMPNGEQQNKKKKCINCGRKKNK